MGKNKARGHIFPNLKIYYKPSVIKRVCYWCTDRHIDQWNRIKKSVINPHAYGQMTFNKGVKEKIVSLKMMMGKLIFIFQRLKLDRYFMSLMKVNLKQMKD